MADKPYQRGGLDEGLAEYLGLKGRLNSVVEQAIRPTVQVSDLADSPYARDYVPVGAFGGSSAAVAELVHVGVRPGASVCLQVKQLRIVNPSGSTLQYSVGTMAGGTIASLLAAASVSAVAQLFQLNVGGPQGGSGTVRPSQIFSATSPAIGPFNTFDIAIVPATSVMTLSYPDPGVLILTTPGNLIAGLVARCDTANFAATVAFYGREWPIPG